MSKKHPIAVSVPESIAATVKTVEDEPIPYSVPTAVLEASRELRAAHLALDTARAEEDRTATAKGSATAEWEAACTATRTAEQAVEVAKANVYRSCIA